MSDLGKVIDKKLADARKRSEKKEETNCNDKKSDQNKTSSSQSKSSSNAKTVRSDEKYKDTKGRESDRQSNSSKKPEPKGGASVKKDDKSGGGKAPEKDNKQPDPSKVDKESGNKNSGPSKVDKEADSKKSGPSKVEKASDNKNSAPSKANKESGNKNSGPSKADKESDNKKPGPNKADKESDKISNGKDSASDKKSAASSKTKPEDSNKDDKDKPNPKDAAAGSDVKPKESKDSRETSKSRTSRDRSRSPKPFVRNYYYRKNFEGRVPYRGGRSPARQRSRSRSSSRRKSRSPVRRRSRSPTRSRDSWRRSPRRRSRSPRSHRGRSRSSERRDPKALMAKKSFLDDLAVKFAQEGKEFPELEQYRCEINSQFSSHSRMNQFSRNAVEHSCANDMLMEMEMLNVPMNNPIVLTDPYNAYPMYPETPSMIPYPMGGVQPPLDSPGMGFDSPRPSTVSPFQKENPSVPKPMNEKQNAGTQPTQPTEIWTKQEVKIRIKQALQLLDDADKAVTKTGKFMFRAPTFHGYDVNENRSPIVQSANNPLFAISNRDGKFSDPFGNVPAKLKTLVDVLRMDEGLVSRKIHQRQQKKQEAISTKRGKLEAEERTRRQENSTMVKPTLQKTTQTDPTVCTDCLLRKIKVRYNEETQTEIVRTVDSGAQTNPTPVQTVSEFGSITELTPNQVRAVSELIKYIKLTVTSGSLKEMRDSLKEDQVYNLNRDLRTAYHYFDAMVEHQNVGVARTIQPHAIQPHAIQPHAIQPHQIPSHEIQPHEAHAGDMYEQPDDYNEPETFIEDENVDEYEDFHRVFCPDDDEDDEEAEEVQYNPLLQTKPSSFKRPKMDNRNSNQAFGNHGGKFGGPSRGRGGGRGTNRGMHGVPYNRRN